MKIEKISDNQIKCTLNQNDLASRQIKLSELAYGTEKAKMLFRDMMQQASLEFGFEAEDIPLMIEAIPVSADCIILIITKVEDPEELDTRFSRFAPSDEDFNNMEDITGTGTADAPFTPSDDLTDMLQQLRNHVSAALGQDPAFKSLREHLEAAGQQNTPAKPAKRRAESRIFSFGNLRNVVHVSELLRGRYDGSNALFKSPYNKRFYLIVYQAGLTSAEFSTVCCILEEYGKVELSANIGEAYIREHFTKIIPRRAIQQLQKINDRRSN